MKKSLLLWLVGLISLVSLSCTAPSKSVDSIVSANKLSPSLYRSEQLALGVIRVVGLHRQYLGNDEWTYGDAFATAIKEIDREYDIVQVVPINVYIGRGSITKELYVMVKPKNK